MTIQISLQNQDVVKEEIILALLNEDFFENSAEFGYVESVVEDYKEEINDLLKLWNKQKFVEIYSKKEDRKWGRIKNSNSTLGSSPFYIGLYHTRAVEGDNDPILVVKFFGKILSIMLMTDHDDMFGTVEEKRNPKALKAKKRKISDIVNSSTEENKDK